MANEDYALARLPEPARAVLDALIRQRDDALVLLQAATSAAQDVRTEMRAVEQHLSRSRTAVQRDETAERALQRTIAATRKQLADRQRIVAERGAALQPLSELIANMVGQLSSVPEDKAFAPHSAPEWKPNCGENPADAVVRLRG